MLAGFSKTVTHLKIHYIIYSYYNMLRIDITLKYGLYSYKEKILIFIKYRH